jgi:hypothetical protein
MEVNEAIEFLEKVKESEKYYFETTNLNNKEEDQVKKIIDNYNDIISLLKSLKAENKVYRNEQSGWVKEIERRQAKIRELEKLDLNVRGLMLENKALQAENKAYKGMWEELKPTDDYECLILEERHLLSKMGNLENKYLGGGE